MKVARLFVLALAIAAPAFAAGMLAEGDPFPAWKATGHQGKTVSSTAYTGRAYLLWFYPKAMTPG